ncbi:bifunctional DNA primase/polymerase [Microbacterium sp. 2FI]|uniref:bifunctional DNA primase/polymerase n=1 Tax=Microbacterium sp. 2FI TaxID=2502193 RepID=UPI0010F8AB84|nr:bifunctional DNA primase/polymerase [Microbacterium sp. 2FI]
MNFGDLLLISAGMSRGDFAVTLAREDIPVFPCIPGGKRPLTPAGFRDASTLGHLVNAWWRRWPDANIGMPTGPRSGFDVVDVDVRGDESGFAGFLRALSAHLADGEIARVHTPSDGMHVYYPATSAQRCWQAARAHIDFRGDGGYVIVPPSVIQTERGPVAYRLTSLGKNPEPIEAVALRAFVDPRPVPTSYTGSTGRTNPTVLASWVARLQEGERNRGLFWAACRLYESGMPPREAVSALLPAAKQAGLGEPEIIATLHSAWRHTGPEEYGPRFTRFASPAARIRRPGSGPSLP